MTYDPDLGCPDTQEGVRAFMKNESVHGEIVKFLMGDWYDWLVTFADGQRAIVYTDKHPEGPDFETIDGGPTQ